MNNSSEDVSSNNNSNSNSYNTMMCRMTKIGSLSRPEFEYFSSAQCYRYLSSVIDGFQARLQASPDDGLFYYYAVNSSSPPLLYDPSQLDVFEQTMSPKEFAKWRQCSKEAMRCCDDVMALESIREDGSTCPSIWDGWSCHMATRAGEYSIVKCPEHHVADTCHTILGYVNFKCELNGTWFSNNHGEWANYTQCLQPYYEFKEQIIDLNIVSHFISLIFLLTGLIIFYSYRKLDVNRITFHKQFFISLILHSLMQIIWEFKFMRESLKNYDTYISSNHYGCIVANLLLNYARSTNYFWMFNESFYLFKLLIRVFDSSSNLAIYYIIGWGFPFIICAAYAIVSYSYSNYGCWTQNLKFNLIIIIPNAVIILLNLLFMLFILRLLYRTLSSPNKNEINQYKRTFKATLILVPMFGLHYFLSPIVLCDSEIYARVYNIFSRLLENLQGVMVALLYCFFNKEVQLLIKKSWRAKKFFELLSLDEFRHGLAPTSTELSHLDTLTGTGVQIKRESYKPADFNL